MMDIMQLLFIVGAVATPVWVTVALLFADFVRKKGE